MTDIIYTEGIYTIGFSKTDKIVSFRGIVLGFVATIITAAILIYSVSISSADMTFSDMLAIVIVNSLAIAAMILLFAIAMSMQQHGVIIALKKGQETIGTKIIPYSNGSENAKINYTIISMKEDIRSRIENDMAADERKAKTEIEVDAKYQDIIRKFR